MNVRRAMKLIIRSFSAVPSETSNIKKRRGSCSLLVTEARGGSKRAGMEFETALCFLFVNSFKFETTDKGAGGGGDWPILVDCSCASDSLLYSTYSISSVTMRFHPRELIPFILYGNCMHAQAKKPQIFVAQDHFHRYLLFTKKIFTYTVRYIHLKRTHLIIVKIRVSKGGIHRCGLGIILCDFFVLQTLTGI